MTELVKQGKQRTIGVAISMLTVSLIGIILYHVSNSDVDSIKVLSQIIRFSLTIALLVEAYKGKKWAKVVTIILAGLAVLTSIGAFISLEGSLLGKIPFIIMAVVYGITIYHFGFSKSFKAFYAFQNRFE
mgnify:CR=1 FL=1